MAQGHRHQQSITHRVSRIVHNPWAILAQMGTVIALAIYAVNAFYAVDKRVVRTEARLDAHDAQFVEFASQMDDIRADANADRAEIRGSLQRLNDKMDEINRYLRDNAGHPDRR